MRTSLLLTFVALTALSLTACDKKPPTPEVRDVRTDASAAPASTPESWLPPADSASMAAPVATPTPTGERNNAATSNSPENKSMPMAGQNNDHSAPLVTDKPASRP